MEFSITFLAGKQTFLQDGRKTGTSKASGAALFDLCLIDSHKESAASLQNISDDLLFSEGSLASAGCGYSEDRGIGREYYGQ